MKGAQDENQEKQQGEVEQNNEEKHILEQKQQILNNSGVLAAYEYFLRRLCKDGFPSGNVYEYAAQAVLKFEKKKQAEQFRQQTMVKSLAELQLNEKLKAQLQVKGDEKNDAKNHKEDKSPQKGKDQKDKSPQKGTKDQKGKDEKKDTKAQDPKQKKK